MEALRPRGTAQPAADLSLTCPSPETGAAKPLISRGEVVEARARPSENQRQCEKDDGLHGASRLNYD